MNPSAYRRLRSLRIPLSIALVALVSTTLAVALTPTPVFARDVFGSLRAPGDAAFIVGHRGDRAEAPENTLVSLELAMDSTAAFVETDVQLTRDRVPVLFHDRDLERVAGVDAAIADLDLAEVRRLDVGAWYSPQYAGTGIPTLAEFFAALVERPQARALVELKRQWTADDFLLVTGLIDRYALRDRVVLQSFNVATIIALERSAPQYPKLLLARELPDDPVPLAARLGVIAIATTAKAVRTAPDAVELLHAAGYGVLCYTLNSEETWAEVRALGVDGIITDEPSGLDAWLAATAPGT
ncbi:glycerophosphodiester phosphodiesterase family protein [Agromyces seonyuensis]|uniref:GP-PDE domain-containing protein n=1 Tax=Agromyces seonyuensis TaxID=2662446 RepID=A0A6I4NZL9_9MICO|nr:hypothetical protein [Agromyces seonyuensis]